MHKHPWLPTLTNQQHAVYLLCFPFAGGGAEYYLPWQKHFPENWQVMPVQLPGRSYRFYEKSYTDIVELLPILAEQVMPALENKNFYLFGHSMGAYIAYKFCHYLQAHDLPKAQGLFVSAALPPKAWYARDQLSALPEAEFNQFFRTLGGFHPDLLKHEQFMQLQLNLLRKDLQLCESCHYTGEPKLSIPLYAFAGRDDSYITPVTMQDWAHDTQAAFKFFQFTGGHFYLTQHFPEIATHIQGVTNYDRMQ